MIFYIWCHPDTGRASFASFEGATWMGRYKAPEGSRFVSMPLNGIVLVNGRSRPFTASDIVLDTGEVSAAGIRPVGQDDV